MYSRFNFKPSVYFYNSMLNKHLSAGSELFESHQKEVQNCLAKYISVDGVINGTNLKNDWFSISNKNIFISHSHKDINRVKAFAGWLHEEFGLTAFIDSCCWGYCDELLKKIDDKYCYNHETKTYDYNLRNYTTSHVHMMLSTALTEMIDKTECIIFFNTPNSINMKTELDKIERKEIAETESPWIYHELFVTSVLEQRRQARILAESIRNTFTDSSLQISHDVEKYLKKLTPLTEDNLIEWERTWNTQKKTGVQTLALDLLYQIISKKE